MRRGSLFFALAICLAGAGRLPAESATNATPAPVARFTKVAGPNHPVFDWRSVESEDYRVYVKNLQSVGCPPETVRDIVTADVIGAFGARRGEALAARYAEFKYWKADPSETGARALLQTRHREIDGEMNEVLRELLGTNTPAPDTSREWRMADLDYRLAFLSPDQRAAIKPILTEHQSDDLLVKELAAGINVSEDPNESMDILNRYHEKQNILKNLLSADEYKMVELTTSWTGENLRRAMVHFNPTEEEFRIIFDAWQSYDENLARIHATHETDPGNLQEAVFAGIEKQFSAARFAEYRGNWWK